MHVNVCQWALWVKFIAIIILYYKVNIYIFYYICLALYLYLYLQASIRPNDVKKVILYVFLKLVSCSGCILFYLYNISTEINTSSDLTK